MIPSADNFWIMNALQNLSDAVSNGRPSDVRNAAELAVRAEVMGLLEPRGDAVRLFDARS